ncbi:GMC family oxidoreductase, partial [Azospirillum sp. B506]|uniref:GMC family oxidoreductase n=1 Tax=Azospirillum sp. B506 TaxID=137721 RepID=UPI0005B28FA9
GYLFCIGNPRTDWCFKTEAEPGLNGRSIHYARGKVLGGCSSINGMIAMRGQARDYDEWATITGDSRWSWKEVLPVFKGSEDYWRGADEMHGSGGEWRVERQRLRWDLLDRFAEAAQQAGIPRNDDFNRGDNLGVGSFEVNQKGGIRWSAAKAFLRPALDRPNLKLVIDAAIDRVETADGRATGIRFTVKGEPARATSKIETVLAAGAIGSPAILQRSGIGPAEHLKKLGIPVVLDAPDVGANLQDHLQLRMIYKVDGIVTLNKRAGSLLGKAMMGLEYALFRKGPLNMAPSQLGVFAKSSPQVETARPEYHVQPLSLEKFGDPLHGFPAFTARVCDLRPASRGWTRIITADHRENPAIAPCYLSDPADRAKAAKALALTRRIASQPALAPYHPQEYKPGPSFQTEEELARAAGDIGTTIFHPVGTCRMGGKDDATAVTDPEMRVRGLRGLRVIDASVMPTLTSGNTNTPTVMIAERGAALMRAERLAALRG